MTDIVMPRLSDSMEEGTILRWLKTPGDVVSRGDDLVEIETDKANMTYESDAAGVLEIVAQEGETLLVGALIARLSGEDLEKGEPTPAVAEPPREGLHPSRIKASPLARRLAKELDLDLGEVEGTGPLGRITKADIERATASTTSEIPAQPPQPSTAAGVLPPTPEHPSETGEARPPSPERILVRGEGGGPRQATAKGESRFMTATRIQATIARRMSESKATIPDFSVAMDIDMHAAAELRDELREMALEAVPSYNDMIVRACALALREHPNVNASYRDGGFELHSRVNVGIAVATDDALIVPTLFDADLKGLEQIASESRTLAARVRGGEITPPEVSGQTFTVSNLGMFGVREFTAIINSPQAAILAAGAVAPRVVARDGDPVVRETMTATLVCDHRILYGAPAARFLGRVRELLEHPLGLVRSL